MTTIVQHGDRYGFVFDYTPPSLWTVHYGDGSTADVLVSDLRVLGEEDMLTLTRSLAPGQTVRYAPSDDPALMSVRTVERQDPEDNRLPLLLNGSLWARASQVIPCGNMSAEVGLREFKQRVAEVAMRYARENDADEVGRSLLAELGVDVPEVAPHTGEITITLRYSARAVDERDHWDDFIRQSLSWDASDGELTLEFDSDWKDVEFTDVTLRVDADDRTGGQ